MSWDPHKLCSDPGCGLCNPPPACRCGFDAVEFWKDLTLAHDAGVVEGRRQVQIELQAERKVLEDHWRKGPAS